MKKLRFPVRCLTVAIVATVSLDASFSLAADEKSEDRGITAAGPGFVAKLADLVKERMELRSTLSKDDLAKLEGLQNQIELYRKLKDPKSEQALKNAYEQLRRGSVPEDIKKNLPEKTDAVKTETPTGRKATAEASADTGAQTSKSNWKKDFENAKAKQRADDEAAVAKWKEDQQRAGGNGGSTSETKADPGADRTQMTPGEKVEEWKKNVKEQNRIEDAQNQKLVDAQKGGSTGSSAPADTGKNLPGKADAGKTETPTGRKATAEASADTKAQTSKSNWKKDFENAKAKQRADDEAALAKWKEDQQRAGGNDGQAGAPSKKAENNPAGNGGRTSETKADPGVDRTQMTPGEKIEEWKKNVKEQNRIEDAKNQKLVDAQKGGSQGSSADAGAKKSKPQTETTKQTAPQAEPPRKTAPQTETPRKTAPQAEPPRKTAPQAEPPRKTAPQTEPPRKTASQTGAPKKPVPKSGGKAPDAPGKTKAGNIDGVKVKGGEASDLGTQVKTTLGTAAKTLDVIGTGITYGSDLNQIYEGVKAGDLGKIKKGAKELIKDLGEDALTAAAGKAGAAHAAYTATAAGLTGSEAASAVASGAAGAAAVAALGIATIKTGVAASENAIEKQEYLKDVDNLDAKSGTLKYRQDIFKDIYTQICNDREAADGKPLTAEQKDKLKNDVGRLADRYVLGDEKAKSTVEAAYNKIGKAIPKLETVGRSTQESWEAFKSDAYDKGGEILEGIDNQVAGTVSLAVNVHYDIKKFFDGTEARTQEAMQDKLKEYGVFDEVAKQLAQDAYGSDETKSAAAWKLITQIREEVRAEREAENPKDVTALRDQEGGTLPPPGADKSVAADATGGSLGGFADDRNAQQTANTANDGAFATLVTGEKQQAGWNQRAEIEQRRLLDAGGDAAKAISDQSASDTAVAQDKNSWATAIGDGVQNAAERGASGFGESFGGTVGDQLGERVASGVFDNDWRPHGDSKDDSGPVHTSGSKATSNSVAKAKGTKKTEVAKNSETKKDDVKTDDTKKDDTKKDDTKKDDTKKDDTKKRQAYHVGCGGNLTFSHVYYADGSDVYKCDKCGGSIHNAGVGFR